MTSCLRLLRPWLVLGVLSACAGNAPPAQAPDGISASKDPPPPGARALRELRAVDGEGCGFLGTMGSYEGAVAKLRDQARALGADYLRITDVKEPYADHECAHKEYTVTAVAYRVAPVPAPAAAASTAPSAAAPPPSPLTSATPAERGLVLGAGGCSLRAAEPAAVRTLSFSARVPSGTRLDVVIDGGAGAPDGLALAYDGAARRIELVRTPSNAAVTVGPEPFALDDGWHDWRIERAADRVSVSLDQRVLLLYAAPAPSASGFTLQGEKVELRSITVSAGR